MFESYFYPETNPFWERVENTLKVLENNSDPHCKGFYFSYNNCQTGRKTSEIIGLISSAEKKYKYLNDVDEKVNRVLLSKNAVRSKDLLEKKKIDVQPGCFCIGSYCAAISGHGNPMICEAIALSFLIAKHFVLDKNNESIEISFENIFFKDIFYEKTKNFQERFAPDNPWVIHLVDLIVK